MGKPNRNMWNIHFSKGPFAYFGNRRPGGPVAEGYISVSNETGKVLSRSCCLTAQSFSIMSMSQNNPLGKTGQILLTHLLKGGV